MRPQSTHTQHKRKNHYAPGTSRGARSATTLLAQVADLERGQRIKARRVELHLTQPAVVDLIEELAKDLPPEHALHPDNAGKAPVTLRGLQTWEQGGGVAWEKAKLLAQALQTDARSLINGVPVDAPTPDLSRGGAGQDDTEDRLARMEARLDQHAQRVEELLEEQSELLKQIRGATSAFQAVVDQARAGLGPDATRDRA